MLWFGKAGSFLIDVYIIKPQPGPEREPGWSVCLIQALALLNIGIRVTDAQVLN